METRRGVRGEVFGFVLSIWVCVDHERVLRWVME